MLRMSQLVRWLLSIGLIFLVTFTLMRLGLFLSDGQKSFSLFELGDAFLLGLRYDLRIIAVLLLIMLIVGSFPWLHPFKSMRGYLLWMSILALATAFFVIFYALDFAHYAYLEQRLNASVLNYLEDAGISMTMVWQSYPVIRLILAILVTMALITWLLRLTYRRIQKKQIRVTRRTRIVSFIVFFLIAGFFIFGKFNQYPLRWSDAFAMGSDYKANLALNPFQSFFSTLKFRHSNYDEARVKELVPVLNRLYPGISYVDKELNFARSVIAGSNTTSPNIILVIAESFSAYKSSMWGNPLNTTPFFDSLCRNGLFFDRCFTPSYGTARGVWATITGIPDVEIPKTASRNPLAVDQHTIVNDFTGYEKYYFLGGSTSWANIRGVLTNNITELHLYEEDNFDAPKVDVWGISDKNLFLEAGKILGKENKPFFAVIQTAGNHRPYTIPEEDLQEFKKVNIPADSLKKFGFDNEAEVNAFRYTDFCFRKFMEAAQKEKYFTNTIFVFIGDHGIPGNAGSMFPAAWTDQRLTSIHVPLLFYSPGIIKPARVNTICSQLDILPTIAGLSNVSYTNTTLGRNMLDSTLTGAAFVFDPDNNMTGIITGDFFYRKQQGTNKEELVSVINNQPSQKNAYTDSITTSMKQLTDAIYETAKYMLLNNKKANGQ